MDRHEVIVPAVLMVAIVAILSIVISVLSSQRAAAGFAISQALDRMERVTDKNNLVALGAACAGQSVTCLVPTGENAVVIEYNHGGRVVATKKVQIEIRPTLVGEDIEYKN